MTKKIMNNRFNLNEEEKNRIRGLHKNYSIIKEQNEVPTYQLPLGSDKQEGWNCVEDSGYTICSKKDKYGYMIRVFKGESILDKLGVDFRNKYASAGPDATVFQAGGKTWEETKNAFTSNAQKHKINLQAPTEEPK